MKRISWMFLLLLGTLLLSGCRREEPAGESREESEVSEENQEESKEGFSEEEKELIRNALTFLSEVKELNPRAGRMYETITNEEVVSILNTVGTEYMTEEDARSKGYGWGRLYPYEPFWQEVFDFEIGSQYWYIDFYCSLPEPLVGVQVQFTDREIRGQGIKSCEFFIENEELFRLVRYKGRSEYDIDEEMYRKIQEDSRYQIVKDTIEAALQEDREAIEQEDTDLQPYCPKACGAVPEVTTFQKARSYEAEGYQIELYRCRIDWKLDNVDRAIIGYPEGCVGGMRFDPWLRISTNFRGPLAVQYKDGKVVSAAFLGNDLDYIGEDSYQDCIPEVLRYLEEARK